MVYCRWLLIPVKGYVFDISFAFFSLRKLKANWWLELFKFFIHKYSGLFFSITQDLLTIFSIHQSHDGLFWITFWLSYETAVLYISMRNVDVGRLKYLNNGCSRLLSPILSGIPVISILFLWSYCSTEYVSASRVMTLCCKFTKVSFAFLSWIIFDNIWW